MIFLSKTLSDLGLEKFSTNPKSIIISHVISQIKHGHVNKKHTMISLQHSSELIKQQNTLILMIRQVIKVIVLNFYLFYHDSLT